MQSDRGEGTPEAHQDLVHGGGGGGGVAGAQDDGHGSSGGAVATGVDGAVGGDEEVPIIPPAAAAASAAPQHDGFIDSTAMGSTTLDEGEWECPACTFINEDPLLLACAICGSLRVEDQDMPIDPEKQPMKPEVIDGDEGPPSFHDTNNNVAMKIKDDRMKPEQIEQDYGPMMPLGQVSDGSDAIINKKAGMKPEHIEDDGAPMSSGHIVSDGSEDLKPSKKRYDNRVKSRVLVAHEGKGSANQTSGQQPSTATQQVPNSPRDLSSSGTSPQTVNGLIPPNDGTGQLQPTPSAQPEQTSTMQRDTDFSVRNFPALEARLVEEEPAIPYVEAVPLETHITQEGNNNGRSTQPWWKEHKRLTIFIVILFVIIAGMGATMGGILSSNSGNDPSAVEDMNAGTADPPNEESAPSPVNSTGPLTEPSQQSGGSDMPSLSIVDTISTNETVIQDLNISIEETSAAPTQPVSKQPTLSPVLPEQPTNTPTQPEIASPTNIFDTKNEPTKNPTKQPTSEPTTKKPTSIFLESTSSPTYDPSRSPTPKPSSEPSLSPSSAPTPSPSQAPSLPPSHFPTMAPTTNSPTSQPTTEVPTESPSLKPTANTFLKCSSHGNGGKCGGTSLQLMEKCSSSDSAENDNYGHAVAVTTRSNNDVYAVVGARNHDRSGSAYLISYDRALSSWEHVVEFIPGGASANGGFDGDEDASYDQFGSAVAISPDWVVVAAPYETASTGRVSLFWIDSVLGGGQLVPDVELVPDDKAYGMCFGSSLAISGDTLVVGAERDRSRVGSVYVYKYTGGEWKQVSKLEPDDVSHDSQGNFGVSVAISDGIVVVGAPYDGTSGRRRNGSVYVYAESGSSYSLVEKITPFNLLEGDQFGISVAIESSQNPSTNAREVRLAIGARFDDDKGQDSGSVYTYLKSDSSNTFTFDRLLLSSTWSPGAEMGSSVAMQGRNLIVGAKKWSGTGGVHYFRHGGTSWTEVEVVTPSGAGGSSGDEFGSALALTEDVAIIGSYANDEVGADGGTMYSYSVCN